MTKSIKIGVIGLGKMGISHLAILKAHPEFELVAGCDTTRFVTDILDRYANIRCYRDYDQMLDQTKPDAVLVATPSRLHHAMVERALTIGAHVFCEKPFVLNVSDGERIVDLAEKKGVVTQVGYHYRFVAAFQEAARVVASGALGDVHHVRVEAFGPVVLRPKGSTWRTFANEGGGALYDYACHAIDLINFVVGVPTGVGGVIRNSLFSRDVEDEIYCSMYFPNGASGHLAVNWSDESYRKMSTKISIWGRNGRLVADRQECQVYLREPVLNLPEYLKGWTVRYTTELTDPVWFYLRGEEYSAQLDYFAKSISAGRIDGQNNFKMALNTDRIVEMIRDSDQNDRSTTINSRHRSFLQRMFG